MRDGIRGCGLGDSAARPPTPLRRLRGTPSRSSPSAVDGCPRRQPARDRRRRAAAIDRSATPDPHRRKRRHDRRRGAWRIPSCGVPRQPWRLPPRSRWRTCRGGPVCPPRLRRRFPRGRHAGRPLHRRGFRRVHPLRRRWRDRRFDDRQVESEEETRPRRQLAELTRDDLCRFAHDFAPAVAAVRATDARVQQPHVVVDFRRRADGRTRDF